MIALHPEFITKNGEKEFAVLPYEEYLGLREMLEDYEDLVDLRKAQQREGAEPTIPLAEVKGVLGL